MRRTTVKQIAWNMLHKIWNICMMQQINIFQWNSAHYETRNICFLKYISWNLLIVLREEMLRNLRCCFHVLRQFKWKDYNILREIYFLYVHWAANMLHAIYLWNMFHKCVPRVLKKQPSRNYFSYSSSCEPSILKWIRCNFYKTTNFANFWNSTLICVWNIFISQ